jgi:hypothetical protein
MYVVIGGVFEAKNWYIKRRLNPGRVADSSGPDMWRR